MIGVVFFLSFHCYTFHCYTFHIPALCAFFFWSSIISFCFLLPFSQGCACCIALNNGLSPPPPQHLLFRGFVLSFFFQSALFFLFFFQFVRNKKPPFFFSRYGRKVNQQQKKHNIRHASDKRKSRAKSALGASGIIGAAAAVSQGLLERTFPPFQ